MRTNRTHIAVWGAVAPVLALFSPALAADKPWGDPDEMKIPTLNAIQVPTPDRMEMTNGMIVYYLEDHEFPLVDVRAVIRGGGIYDPADKVGLASITGEVMRTGGTTSIPGDVLDAQLESMGASIETWFGDTDGGAALSALSEDLEDGLRLFNDVLRNPSFPEDKIDLARKQERTSIASRNDEMFDILGRELSKLIYGPTHPYARHTEYATVDAITRSDLVAFHGELVHPDRIILTVYGDFDRKQVEASLTRLMSDWARSTRPLAPEPAVAPTAVKGIFVADKENTTNSAVVLGHEGMRMDNPDYAAMQVFHQIMGGGFSSRLFGEIRTRLGLAYATGSGSGAGIHHPGGQIFYAVTQSDSTTVTLKYMEKEIDKALTTPFTEVELRLGKDAILNSLVFDLSSKGAVLNRLATYEFYGYPRDFLETYQKQVESLTAQDVLAAAKRNVREGSMATLIVGTKSTFGDDLAALGPYTDVDISIPEPAGAAVPEASPEDLARGQEILGKAAAATGGAAIAQVRDVVSEESGVLAIQGMELQISSKTMRRLPDCVRSEQKFPMGTIVQSLCGDEGWVDQMKGPTPMPPDAVAEAKADQERDLLTLLTAYKGWKVQALPGAETVEGKSCHVVFIHSEGVKAWKVYVDQETNLIARMDYKSTSPMEGTPVTASEFMADYRKVSGVSFPYERRILHDGEPLVTLTTTSLLVNGGVDPAVFKMP